MSYRSFPFGFSRAPDRPRGLRTHVGALVVACAAGLIPFAASAADFTVTPTTLVFGSVPVGATATIVVTITNTTAVSQTPNFSGGAPLDPTNFGGSQNCAGVPLAPGGSCQFNYEFSPATLGAKSSSTSIGINSDNFPITMSGTGISAFSVAPTDLAFGGVPLGTTATIPVTITNTSGVSQTPNFSGGARSIRPTSAAPRIAQAFLWLPADRANSTTSSARRRSARSRRARRSASTPRTSRSRCRARARRRSA